MAENEETQRESFTKIPSGISSIDLASSGGLPKGSFVVLFGKTGTGKEAFMQTSASMNAAMKLGKLPKPKKEDVGLPNKILYILLSKTKEDVKRDVKIGYSEDLSEAFNKGVEFNELMSDYYASTLMSLQSEEAPLESDQSEEEEAIEIVRSIINYLDELGKNNLIILDSLNDLIRAFPSGEEKRLLASLRTIRTQNKQKWNSLILNRLTSDIFPENVEESILSASNGVFSFQSTSSGGSRTRNLICDKFDGITSSELLDSTFEYNITKSGFEARRTDLLEV
ncbi:MAG: RAD55 family ATPase [Candidatus Hadarchaeia archaeon]